MLKIIAFLFIAFPVSTPIQSQQPISKDQQEVQQTVIQFFEALSRRDSVSLKNYCTADIALFENGSTWNADTLILKAITLNNATDFRRTNTIDFISTAIKKNTAWATYNLFSEFTRNGMRSTVQWLETVVAVKEGKKWKIKVLHSTLIKRTTLSP